VVCHCDVSDQLDLRRGASVTFPAAGSESVCDHNEADVYAAAVYETTIQFRFPLCILISFLLSDGLKSVSLDYSACLISCREKN
jgi:hypothetical protein